MDGHPRIMPAMPNPPKSLKEIEAEGRAKRPERVRRKRKKHPELGQSRIGKATRTQKRLPPPVPPGLTLDEVKAMDPDDPRLKHPQGRPRKWEGVDTSKLSVKDIQRMEHQARRNKKRAKVRKFEAEVVKTVEEKGIRRAGAAEAVEDRMIANHLIDIEDWDAEELVRGYRRDRRGRFGTPPKYIPREVQQACFRRLVKLGERDMQAAYMRVLERLIAMAQGYRIDPETGEREPVEVSDKVQLQAIQEVMNRTVGKVADKLNVQSDAPWQDFLADSLEPISVTTTQKLTIHGEMDDDEEDADIIEVEFEPLKELPEGEA